VLVVSDQPFGPERVLIDPNPLTPDGSTALADSVPDRSGRLVVFSFTEAGSDWNTWRVLDAETGAERPDVVRWSKFSRAALAAGRQRLLVHGVRRS
jgi:prolyl oligopeptidase